MSKTNTSTEVMTEEVKTESVVAEKVDTLEKETVGKIEVTKKDKTPVISFSAATQKMNARQFFDQYPHDNAQVVALIIALYGNKTKTVAEWEAFYQQMLKKKVS